MAVDSANDPSPIRRPAPAALRLTRAIQPASEFAAPLVEGYRLAIHRDRPRRLRIPMLTAAVSADHLFDAFLALIRPLGDMVDVVLESSHGRGEDAHHDYRRGDIDRPVLESYCCEFEDLLVNDGCTGVAALAAGLPAEVQLDEHKLLVVYAADLAPFRRVLRRFGVRRVKGLDLVCDGEHLHHTTDGYADTFERFANRLGVIAESGDVDEWESGRVGE
jgi:hypothetical protein